VAQLLIPQWIAFAVQDVALYIHPKGNKEINNNRRPHGEKTQINEVQPDF
jgi:hypothetical protein